MKILSAVAAIIFFAVGAMAQMTNDLSDAEIQGRKLAQQLCESKPTENFTNSGVHQIRDNGSLKEVPLKCETVVTPTNWYVFYSAGATTIKISHYSFNQSNKYEFQMEDGKELNLFGNDLMVPFVGSDFWIADLGLEFFHWPEQKILKRENRRSRACNVLESTNPDPSTNGYSRVVSWIDEESGGIVHAEAYDAQNKLLKEFDPKSFKKVNGQWELQEMEIRNVQTGSRSRIEFDLKK